MFNYVVTAQKSTSVVKTITCNFTAPDEVNLIVCKSTRIEIHTLRPEGLQPFLEVGIYGRIACLEAFRNSNENKDLLLLTTEKYNICILEYDTESGEIRTRASGDIQDKGIPTDHAQIGIVDPDSRLMAFHIFNGWIKTIGIKENTGQVLEAVNYPLEEMHVRDIQFLHLCAEPTVAVLFKDNKDQNHLRSYKIVKDVGLQDGVDLRNNLPPTTSKIIPVPKPYGGLLLVSETSINYINTRQTAETGHDAEISIALDLPTAITAYGQVDTDGSRFLFGDIRGHLYILLLEHDSENNKITGLKLERLGVTSIPSSISYLDNGVIYVGSQYGDSQLIKLNPEPDEEGSHIEILDTFTNLGPIADFCVVDLERQGQGQIVTCSGAFKDGSLRIIRNGIGITEQASIEMEGVKGIWSLKDATGNTDSVDHDKFLVVSFVGQTRVLGFSDDQEMSETEIPGLDASTQSILCSNVCIPSEKSPSSLSNHIVQVTQQAVRLINGETLMLDDEWVPEEGSINVASCNLSGQIIVSLSALMAGSNRAVYLEAGNGKLAQIASTQLENEIACLNLNPLRDSDEEMGGCKSMARANYCAVGLWTSYTVHILRLPNLEEVTRETLHSEYLPRSLLFITLEAVDYLLATLGDGHLFTFTFDSNTGSLGDRHQISLGTQPILLNRFISEGAEYIFATSDRPTVISSSNKKLLFSNVNLSEVEYMSAFNPSAFPDSLVIYANDTLSIGSIENIQKLHVRTIPLGEMPRRICHQESSRVFGVVTQRIDLNESTYEETEQSFLRIFDDQTFDMIDFYTFPASQQVWSITSVTFSGSSVEYIAVGVAVISVNEMEPREGFIYVFQVNVQQERKLVKAAQLRVSGCPLCLESFNGNLLAGINSTIKVFTWNSNGSSETKMLSEMASKYGHILTLQIASRGTFFLAGDLMRSVTLLNFNSVDNCIEEIARDYNPIWVTALAMMDEDFYLCAENSFNLLSFRKNNDVLSEEERGKLEVCGEFHLGDLVNRIRHGSLVMKPSVDESKAIRTFLFGSVSGSIGVIANISSADFEFFDNVQKQINKVIGGVGGFEHVQWRSFLTDKKQALPKGFIDGDLIESVLDLRQDRIEQIAGALSLTADELCKRIQDMAQSIH